LPSKEPAQIFEDACLARRCLGAFPPAIAGTGLCLLLAAPGAWAEPAPVELDDPTRPVTTFDFRVHFENDATSGQDDRLSLIFRRNAEWDLDNGWKLGTRIDVPITLANQVTDSNPGGNYETGLGRILVEAYLADEVDDRWAYGFGSQMVAPASASAYGSGNWEAVPLVAVRYMLPEISDGSFFVPQLRYAQSFAQSFSGRDTSNLQFSPQLKVVLPDKWFFIAWPNTDIRWNFGQKASGQTGRLFLPLDLEVGRNLAQAHTVSLEVSTPLIRDYPVYRIKIEARYSARF
jgi:hypothetical protein